MLVIVCPHCGPRDDAEFAFHGEIVARPGPDANPATWRRYLYTRRNVAGWQVERWFHGSGCRRFLTIERHTVTNEIRAVRDVASEGP
jgi:heterotetrameric sarcosine oxidase delta subunit